jgi:hypothetical protein
MDISESAIAINVVCFIGARLLDKRIVATELGSSELRI